MDGISTVVNAALGDVAPELLLVAPVAIGVAATLWGVPKAVGFFKRIAK